MNLQEFKNYLKQKKRIKIIEWEKQRQGNYCSGFTDAEYVQSMKASVENHKQPTRRAHSKGAYWNYKIYEKTNE